MFDSIRGFELCFKQYFGVTLLRALCQSNGHCLSESNSQKLSAKIECAFSLNNWISSTKCVFFATFSSFSTLLRSFAFALCSFTGFQSSMIQNCSLGPPGEVKLD